MNNVSDEDKNHKNKFKYSPSTGKVIFAIVFTIFALTKVETYPNDLASTLGSWFGIGIAAYLVWSNALRIWPWSKRELIVEPNKVIFIIGKKSEQLENLEKVTISEKSGIILIESFNKEGKVLKKIIEKKHFTSEDYDRIRLILQSKIKMDAGNKEKNIKAFTKAKFAWMNPIIGWVIVLAYSKFQLNAGFLAVFLGLVILFLLISGVYYTIINFLNMRKFGRKGILSHAIAGAIFNGIIILFLFSIMKMIL